MPNRVLFNDRMEHGIELAKRHHTKLALFFIDLDQFKQINDSLGHQIGDRVLIVVAERLKAKIRKEDTLARLGGDEFSAILTSIHTLEDSIVCFIDKNTFFKLLEENKNFCKEFMKLTQNNLINTLHRLINLNQKQNQGKIAEALLYLSEEIYESNSFTLSISKVELSEMAGMSKESTFKILKSFDNDGIINIGGSTIEILNQDLLNQISNKG